MNTLEEKLLEKMTVSHNKNEIFTSIKNSASTLCKYVESYKEDEACRMTVDKYLPKILANLELNIQLLKKAYYPNTQEFKEQMVQEIAKKYELL